jgi:hypothetical protein
MSDDDERARKERRKRNIVLAISLGALGILMYLMSIVKWHELVG